MTAAMEGEGAVAVDRYADQTAKSRDVTDLPVHEMLTRHDQELASQRETAGMLGTIVGELEQRLGPVLAEPGPEKGHPDRLDTPGGVPFAGQSPVAGRVSALTGAALEIEQIIQRNIERLRDLTARLEV